ncbi:hypothetical protein [Aureimonas sp. AU12]|uniref:hypothetical protein n=1 Tax=Aureimonas sp. AU12 TaxID=1638161 RepID=UPI000784B02E|nr:hypothetical protein [Aureimonas sp. AU12]
MLPHPDSLSLPFKEGIRDLRCSIRLEARSGAVSSRLFGTPRPTRGLASFADGVLSRAEEVAARVLPREGADLGQRLDRLAVGLRGGRGTERPGDLYAVCREILRGAEPAGSLVSELKLAARPAADLPVGTDPILAAVTRAHRMAAGGILRNCLSRTLLPGAPVAHGEGGDDARLALTSWLAVLVRLETGEDGRRVVEGACLAVEAEGETWARLLREKRLAELADDWRRTVPYLP